MVGRPSRDKASRSSSSMPGASTTACSHGSGYCDRSRADSQLPSGGSYVGRLRPRLSSSSRTPARVRSDGTQVTQRRRLLARHTSADLPQATRTERTHRTSPDEHCPARPNGTYALVQPVVRGTPDMAQSKPMHGARALSPSPFLASGVDACEARCAVVFSVGRCRGRRRGCQCEARRGRKPSASRAAQTRR
jgi:hypothetical protein